jgi:deoxyribonuclease-4
VPRAQYKPKTEHGKERRPATKRRTPQRRPNDSAAGGAQPHRFGSHLSIAGGMANAIERARAMGMGALQVFVKNQRQWKAHDFRRDDFERWHELRLQALQDGTFGPIVAHATYLINLAAADEFLYTRSRDAFAEELLRCQALGIPYLVVHPGSAGAQSRGIALRRVGEALQQIFDQHAELTTMPLLETTAGQGTCLGCRFEDLAEIIAQVRTPDRVGVCVDTCHVFSAGYDIRDARGYEEMVRTIRDTVGLERIRCWHLNDSKTAFNSHVDRHEHIGKGQIGLAGFKNLLADARFRGLPMILETPKDEDGSGKMDRMNLKRLRQIAESSTGSKSS